MSWIFCDNRKRQQRKMNRAMRQLNNAIANDELWLGRFFIRQVNYQFVKFADNSGAELYTTVRFYDKKTGMIKDVCHNINEWIHFHHLFREMNDFIVITCDVWREDPRPSVENAVDWRDTYGVCVF